MSFLSSLTGARFRSVALSTPAAPHPAYPPVAPGPSLQDLLDMEPAELGTLLNKAAPDDLPGLRARIDEGVNAAHEHEAQGQRALDEARGLQRRLAVAEQSVLKAERMQCETLKAWADGLTPAVEGAEPLADPERLWAHRQTQWRLADANARYIEAAVELEEATDRNPHAPDLGRLQRRVATLGGELDELLHAAELDGLHRACDAAESALLATWGAFKRGPGEGMLIDAIGLRAAIQQLDAVQFARTVAHRFRPDHRPLPGGVLPPETAEDRSTPAKTADEPSARALATAAAARGELRDAFLAALPGMEALRHELDDAWVATAHYNPQPAAALQAVEALFPLFDEIRQRYLATITLTHGGDPHWSAIVRDYIARQPEAAHVEAGQGASSISEPLQAAAILAEGADSLIAQTEPLLAAAVAALKDKPGLHTLQAMVSRTRAALRYTPDPQVQLSRLASHLPVAALGQAVCAYSATHKELPVGQRRALAVAGALRDDAEGTHYFATRGPAGLDVAR